MVKRKIFVGCATSAIAFLTCDTSTALFDRCFLVSFYFVHFYLPRLLSPPGEDDEGRTVILGEIANFLKDYGSYLRMDTSLVYASALKATSVIDILLNIANHDPRHREALKQMTMPGSMVFYEPVRHGDCDALH